MIFLGTFNPGDAVFCAGNFHNDTGTVETPTSPEAQIRTPAGVWSNLTAPTVQNSKTGQMGGTIDTTGFSSGMYAVRMAGAVSTSKTTAFEYLFVVGFLRPGDSVFVAQNYHNDTGTLEDPTSPEAQIRTPAGVWSALTAPAQVNSKTGHYGTTIDTTGYAAGQYTVRLAGTVTTAKVISTDTIFYLEDISASSTSIRQQLITALVARMETILATNGYRTNVGANVYTWKAGPFLSGEVPGMDIRDSDTFRDDTVGEQEHTLAINIRAIASGDTSDETIRDIQSDIIEAIGTDVTFGGLADDTGTITAEQIDVETADAVKAGCGVRFAMVYTTARFEA